MIKSCSRLCLGQVLGPPPCLADAPQVKQPLVPCPEAPCPMTLPCLPCCCCCPALLALPWLPCPCCPALASLPRCPAAVVALPLLCSHCNRLVKYQTPIALPHVSTMGLQPSLHLTKKLGVSNLQEGVFDEFSKALVEKVNKLKLGGGLDPNTTLGPLISKAAIERVRLL